MKDLNNIIETIEQIRGLSDVGDDAADELSTVIWKLKRIRKNLENVKEIVVNSLGNYF